MLEGRRSASCIIRMHRRREAVWALTLLAWTRLFDLAFVGTGNTRLTCGNRTRTGGKLPLSNPRHVATLYRSCRILLTQLHGRHECRDEQPKTCIDNAYVLELIGVGDMGAIRVPAATRDRNSGSSSRCTRTSCLNTTRSGMPYQGG